MSRSNMVLAAIAAALFAFIVFWERDSLTSGELAETQNQLLQRFVRNRVDLITIERGDERIVIAREREDRDDLIGTWRLREPMAALADDDAVGSALSGVQYASARRTLESPSEADLARYGLDAPRLVASFLVANEEIVVAFGGDDPTGAGIYMRAGDRVHVVGLDVFEALDHDAGHYRSKRILDEGVLLADRLELEGEGGRRVLRSSRDRWSLDEAEGRVRAASARVEEALQAFNDLEAESFVEQGPSFEAAWLRVRAHVPAAEEDGEEREVLLEVGPTCDDETQRYARVDEGAVTCVLVSRLDALVRPAADWRELRPVTTRDLELERLELRAGTTTLTVAQPEGRWRWTLRRGASERSGDADDDALADWLQSIRRARAQSVVSAEDPSAYGLERPVATLTLVDSDEREEVLHVGTVSTEGLYLRRGDEPVILVVPGEAEALFTASAVRLRDRRLLEEATRSITRIAIERDGVTERLEDREGGWRVVAPIDAPAMNETRDLARTLARLQAERFVADQPSAEHGLATPRVVVSAHLEPEEGEARDVVLRIGATTEGGAFAALGGDEAVFVLGDDLVGRVLAPLVSRRLLRTDLIELERLVIETGGTRRELTHDGRRFLTDDGPIEGEAGEAIGGSLERLRMDGATRYGAVATAEGLTPPRARIEVTRDEGAEGPQQYVILVGAPTGEGDAVYVRREDLAVTFTIDEPSLGPLLALP